MKIQAAIEALTNYGDENGWWARPITWRGTGAAVTLDEEGRLITVNLEGYIFQPYEYEIIDEWEILTAGDVIKEFLHVNKKEEHQDE